VAALKPPKVCSKKGIELPFLFQLICFVLFVCLLLFITFFFLTWSLDAKIIKPGLPASDYDYLKTQMQIHGCLVLVRDLDSGKWFFWRHGERCWIQNL